MAVVYLGLGSNLYDPVDQLQQAAARLKSLDSVSWGEASSLYKSQPWGDVPDQPPFINAVACIETNLSPVDLLYLLQSIELAQGRVRDGMRWGPRVIDLDMLLYDSLVYNSSVLTLPHPYLRGRDFVVYPLAEIAPNLVLPGGDSIATVVGKLEPGTLSKIPERYL